MKSARSFSQKNKEDSSSHQFCIHQHFQKCRKERQRQIQYTIFPKDNINTETNAHIKCAKLGSYNFDTFAYEKFSLGKIPETQSDKNFVKNFYLENVPDKKCMTNQIVKELENQVFPFNAYNLAEDASKDYLAFEYKRQQHLISARRRAKNNSIQFNKQLKSQKQTAIAERQKWIQKILAIMQDLGQRMFNLANVNPNKQNQSENGKERIFLNQKSHVNEQFLKQYKIHDPKAAFEIFEDLRANMLKKKKKFQDLRINNQNVNATASYMSEATNQSNNLSQQSMISAVSEADNIQTVQQTVAKLCDFQQLKKKWKTLDVERIKDIILSTLTRKTIFQCQSQKAKQISTYQRQCKSIPSKIRSPSKNKNKEKRSSTQNKNVVNTMNKTMDIRNMYKSKLTSDQTRTKEEMMSSGQLDSVGSRYQKIRNFSNLFKKKQQTMRLNFSTFENTNKQIEQVINYIQQKQVQNFLENNKQFTKGYKTTRTAVGYLRA